MLTKIGRIVLEPLVSSPESINAQGEWLNLVKQLGAKDVETHDKDCVCYSKGCIRLRAVRQYIKAYVAERRIRFAAKALQARLDEHVADERERNMLVDFDDAKAEYMTREFKLESQDESR